MRLTYSDGISDKNPKLLKPRQVQAEEAATISFDQVEMAGQCYVYGHGRLQGIYHQAGDAIRNAMEYEGVVVGPDQAYIWESGNRDLKYSIQGKEGEISEIQKKLAAGTSPVEIIEGIREGQVLDLSGSSCEDLLYIINQDRPVIAMQNAEKGIILVGYQDDMVTYIDGKSGERHSASCEEIDKMTAESGRTYVA